MNILLLLVYVSIFSGVTPGCKNLQRYRRTVYQIAHSSGHPDQQCHSTNYCCCCYCYYYYYYNHLTASFQDNLGKPVPER